MQIVMGWPEWIAVFVVFVSTINNATVIKTQKTIEARIGYWLGVIMSKIFWLCLLYWGGFFS